MSDIIADRDGDRLLFRVKPAAAGESWWAFDARSLSYAGVVGVTVTGAAASAGVDPTSGRLYVVAPKAQSGGQRSGGLYISDIRRSPPPQALVFEEFAGTGTGRIGVDVHPGTGERRIFVPEADHCGPGALCTYRILRDSVPVSADPPMEDQDRLTTDAEEREGVTGATFAGTGHTYGLRALIVGGLEGVPPGGPAVTEIRPGRYGIMRLGSPCQKGDREIVLGKVRNVALSNELAAASAIAGDTDPGTKIDLEQPSARCYPIPPDAARVLQSQGQSWPRPVDPPADSPDGRNDIDREVGRTWPFGPAECAGDGSASRDKTGLGAVEVEGFRASVECKQASGRASARAEARGGETPAFEAEGLPGIGSVRVGEVSGSVQIYRDRARGLVARTTATARGISIGDVISIDAALTISEAWAGGRPGTADTAFVRRLCGVRIPSQDVDLSAVQEVQGNVEAMLREQGVHPPPADLPRTDDVDACGDPGIPVLSPTLVAQFGSPPLVGAMNRALGARGRASAPPPDRALAQGTPGGYLASVQKDRLEQESSRAINNDVTTQVPALELAIYNDDPAFGRGRQIFQFAGTDASVTYGIYLLAGIDTPDEFVDDFDLPEILIDMTGGSDFVQEPPPSGAVRRPRSPFRMLFSGVAFLIRSPRQALLAGVVWAALFSPVALGLRRRSLREVLES
ncbi:MAG: hypothetical protein HY775_06840 [Acidobacteria bacterium]|nr:hypothetical protein [Acidobacteriota bacterium]